MAIRNVIWDSEARRRIEAKELDKLYTKNKVHYDGLAKETWESLQAVSEVPLYLNDGDLWDSLVPILSRDKVTQKGFVARKLPQSPMDRGGGQWFGWFTHFVVDQYLESLATTKKGGSK